MKTLLHAQLETIYLNWVNDFISIEAFASYYGLEVEHAKKLIDLSRDIIGRGDIDK